MKHLIFIILKVVEIAVVVFVPYYTGVAFEFIVSYFHPTRESVPKFALWFVGASTLVIVGAVIALGAIFVHLNKQWSETIWLKIRSMLAEHIKEKK